MSGTKLEVERSLNPSILFDFYNNSMIKGLRTYALVVFLLVACTHGQTCDQNCLDCQQGNCFACNTEFERDVFGACQSNVVDKCVIYGPGQTCFVCQPTFLLSNQSCTKMMDGCLNSDSGNCVDCGFGTTLNNGKCQGVLNCQQVTQQNCQTCSTGYTLKANVCVDNSPGCAQTNPSTGACLSCKTGYFMSGLKCF